VTGSGTTGGAPTDRHRPVPERTLPVSAIVLTFDAQEAVAKCVGAIAAQTAPPREVIVVDNHSVPPVDEHELRQQLPPEIVLRLIRTDDNYGPAGGHARGLRAFLEGEQRYAWVMDDDVEPDTTCLERFVAAIEATGRPVLGGPAIYDRVSGERCDGWGWWGVLVPRAAVGLLGVPREDLFWALEDQEYLRDRLPLGGFDPLRVDEAVVRLERRPDWRDPDRPAGIAYQRDKPDWKYYYEIRNFVFMYLWKRRHIALSVRLKSLTRYLVTYGRCLAAEESDRATKARHYAMGLFDGITGRLGRRVVPSRSDRPTGSVRTEVPRPRSSSTTS
jgi:glycosyltransferase involved in cell wall biosynthesis